MGLANIPPLNGGGGGGAVDSVFGRTGVVTSQSGDYNTDEVTEGSTNKYAKPVEIHNNTGGTLTKGTPVYVTGTHASGKPFVDQADNTDPDKMPCVGVIQDDVLDGADGLALTHGELQNVDTSTVNAGDVIYVGTIAGDRWTTTKPTGTAEIQNMGYVLRSHASAGSVEIQGSGRTNDLPNLTENNYWVGNSNGVPQEAPIPQASFTKYEANSGNTPFSIPSWDSVVEVANSDADIELILPEMPASQIGKEIKFWLQHNPVNHKVLVKANNTDGEINHITAAGAEVAKAEYSSNSPNFIRVTAQVLGENDCHIDQATSVYNELRYVANFTATSDFSPYSYLQLSAIPSNFLTDNADWWFALKIEDPMKNDSDGQVLFGSNNFFIAYRGNGTYFMTSSTSGYLQTISPARIVEGGEWIIYQYNSTSNGYTAWINGEKVFDDTSSGATPPTTAPTEMWFGSETGQASPPSGYGYPLQECKISNMTIGTGNIADADAALFTAGTFRTNALVLSSGTVANEWTFSDTAPVTQVGAVNLTAVGDNLTFEEI